MTDPGSRHGRGDGRPLLHIEPLTTDRLELTPLDPSADAAALHRMLADPEVHRFDTDAQASSSEEETALRLHLQVVANGGASWAIRLEGGDAIGTIGVFADQNTTIRGIGWSLARSHWRRGITSEAARTVVPYLLAQDGVAGLEAWVDSRNVASLGVARAAGMTEGGRLPRSYRDRVAQTVVMVRATQPRDPGVFGISPTLQVADLEATTRLLLDLLDLHLAWEYPDPPEITFLTIQPWSGSHGFRLQRTSHDVPTPQELACDVGVPVDEIAERVLRAGLAVVAAPHEQPWARREMTFELPDGHRITVSGPTLPDG